MRRMAVALVLSTGKTFTSFWTHSHCCRSQALCECRKWCAQLALWEVTSKQGTEEASSANNHGMYLDLSTLALANYGNALDIVIMPASACASA